jgi:hypothetical protein
MKDQIKLEKNVIRMNSSIYNNFILPLFNFHRISFSIAAHKMKNFFLETVLYTQQNTNFHQAV